MYNERLEYLKERLQLITNDLYDTIATLKRILVAKLIDYAIVFIGACYVIYYFLQQEISNWLIFIAVTLWITIYFFVRIMLRGRTIGMMIMNLQYVNVKSKNPISFREYLRYIRKTATLKAHIYQLFKYYLDYDNRHCQNEPMRRFGMIIVDRSKYLIFQREHNYIKNEIVTLEKAL